MLKAKLSLLFLILLVFSCQSQKQKIRLSRDMRESLIENIRSANLAKLQQIDIQDLKQQLLKSSMGASYYYSYIMESEGNIQQSLQLVINEIESQSPFAGWAALRFLDLTDQGAQHNFNLYKALLPMAKNQKTNPDPVLYLATGYAAFFQGKYQETLDYLTAVDPISMDTYPLGRAASMAIALSQTALELPNWEVDLNNFFFGQRGGKDTVWALEWLRTELPKLNLPIYRLYEAVNMDGANQSAQAYSIMKEYIRGTVPNWLNRQPTLIQQFANIAGRSKQRADAVAFLLPYLGELSGEGLFQAQLALGALSFNQGQYTQAITYLTPAVNYGAKSKDLDRAIWYYLSAMYQSGDIPLFVKQVNRLGHLWDNPYYFRNLFQTVLNDLVSRSSFHHIYQIYQNGLREFADAGTSVHYAWVLARATFHSLLIVPKNVDKKVLYNSLLTDSLSVPWSYSSIMAYTLLDEVPPFYKEHDLIPLEINGRVTNSQHLRNDAINPLYTAFSQRALGPDMISDDVYALGFLYYGLVNYPEIYPDIAQKLKKLRSRLSTNALRLMGREFERINMPADSITMMVTTTTREDFEPTKADYIALYPRGYRNIIESTAKDHNIEPHILYGLVWNESLFQNAVASRVGAIGLGQLMKPTAQEMARIAGLKEFDLTNPTQNLVLTSVYFDWLKKRFDGNLIYVLMSYNAGLSHVRKWVKSWGHYPPEIFVEASPFSDTRGYVRDITADSAIYGYLYFNIPPSQTVKTIFPTLQRSQNEGF